ncbi:MAG TPA: hypothetical protein VF509_09160 [Sphingobium sp.]
MGGRPLIFSAKVDAKDMDLVVPRDMWIRALRDTGQGGDDTAIGFKPSAAYRLIEAVAAHQLHSGNTPSGTILALR